MATTKAKTPLIYQKINTIMKKIGAVEKAGKIEFGRTRYNYQTIEDIVSEVRKHMISEGVVIYPVSAQLIGTTVQSVTEKEDAKSKSIVKGKAITTTIYYIYKMVAVEDGSEINIGMIGQGTDSADKGSNKAASGAYKYALKETFMIETGEDDPDKTPSDKYKGKSGLATTKQVDFIKKLSKEKGIEPPDGFPKISVGTAGGWIDTALKAKPAKIQDGIDKMDKEAEEEVDPEDLPF